MQVTLTLLALYAADATVKFINVAAEKAKQARGIVPRVEPDLPSSLPAVNIAPASDRQLIGFDCRCISSDCALRCGGSVA